MGASAGKSPAWPSSPAGEEAFAGTWHYPDGQYCIHTAEYGNLHYTEGSLSGQLHPEGSQAEGDLFGEDGGHVGRIFLRMGEGGTLISNFQLCGAGDTWEDDIVAERALYVKIIVSPKDGWEHWTTARRGTTVEEFRKQLGLELGLAEDGFSKVGFRREAEAHALPDWTQLTDGIVVLQCCDRPDQRPE